MNHRKESEKKISFCWSCSLADWRFIQFLCCKRAVKWKFIAFIMIYDSFCHFKLLFSFRYCNRDVIGNFFFLLTYGRSEYGAWEWERGKKNRDKDRMGKRKEKWNAIKVKNLSIFHYEMLYIFIRVLWKLSYTRL